MSVFDGLMAFLLTVFILIGGAMVFYGVSHGDSGTFFTGWLVLVLAVGTLCLRVKD